MLTTAKELLKALLRSAELLKALPTTAEERPKALLRSAELAKCLPTLW